MATQLLSSPINHSVALQHGSSKDRLSHAAHAANAQPSIQWLVGYRQGTLALFQSSWQAGAHGLHEDTNASHATHAVKIAELLWVTHLGGTPLQLSWLENPSHCQQQPAPTAQSHGHAAESLQAQQQRQWQQQQWRGQQGQGQQAHEQPFHPTPRWPPVLALGAGCWRVQVCTG